MELLERCIRNAFRDTDFYLNEENLLALNSELKLSIELARIDKKSAAKKFFTMAELHQKINDSFRGTYRKVISGQKNGFGIFYFIDANTDVEVADVLYINNEILAARESIHYTEEARLEGKLDDPLYHRGRVSRQLSISCPIKREEKGVVYICPEYTEDKTKGIPLKIKKVLKKFERFNEQSISDCDQELSGLFYLMYNTAKILKINETEEFHT